MPSDVSTYFAGQDTPPPPRPPRRRTPATLWSGLRLPVRIALVLAVALVTALALWAGLSGSAKATPPATSPSVVAGTRTVLRATSAVTAAGTTMSAAMAGLHTLPTVASVSAIVDPYAAALARYDTALTGTSLRPAAATWRSAVLGQVRTLDGLLGTLASTPSAGLGQWIEGFYLQTAELQSAIENLQAALGHATTS